ncbi:amidase [Aureobasidium namibiae CBS 147.97]|uniref:amidase n=1 Tax=Aureobasidium namibiae CBS 147.97 TaxID=1043004 RepID=A0A074WZJ2_9PEZI
MGQSWKQFVAAKLVTRDAMIQKHSRNKSVECSHITALDNITELTQQLRSGHISAQDVVRAYISQACAAQQQTNCLTELCFDDALTQAKRLDDYLKDHGELFGPLHGVPVSLKDQFNVKGLDSTLGYVGRAGKPASSNALIVDVLQDLGAIVLTKTNLPQSILWCETENPLWGLTTHPMNPDFTPGGSSGGEAALLALHGSLLGWGTDIGGSIRIPSHMNGLWGLKPSSGRMSYQGVEVSLEGQQHVPSAVGPMTRSLSSLVLVTKLVIEAEPWLSDSQLPPMPWKNDVFGRFSSKPLVIGIVPDDGVVKVHPPIARVFRETVTKLQGAGHEIVEWDTSLHRACIDIMDEYYSADGGEDVRSAVTEGGEPFVPHVQAFVDRGPPISVYRYWQLNKRKVAAQQAYHDQWNSTRSASGRPVDVLLIPTMPHTAVAHRCCRWVGYTKVFNFLDYTALSFPAGKVDKGIDIAQDESYVPRNDLDAWNQKQYDLESMHGHHISLQLVGRKFEEEKVLGAAQQVEQLLRERVEDNQKHNEAYTRLR